MKPSLNMPVMIVAIVAAGAIGLLAGRSSWLGSVLPASCPPPLAAAGTGSLRHPMGVYGTSQGYAGAVARFPPESPEATVRVGRFTTRGSTRSGRHAGTGLAAIIGPGERS